MFCVVWDYSSLKLQKNNNIDRTPRRKVTKLHELEILANPRAFEQPGSGAYMGVGFLHDPVKWYGINFAGTQMTQWDFQNKGKSGWTGKSSFVFEVPLGRLRPSKINSLPRDRIVQKGLLVNCWQLQNNYGDVLPSIAS